MSSSLAVGLAIRAARESRGWSGAELAQRAECSRSYISMLENGRRGRGAGFDGGRDGGGLARIEAVLGMSPGALARVGLKTLMRATDRSGGVVSANLDAAWRSGDLAALAWGRASAGESAGPASGLMRVERLKPTPLELPLINSVAAGYPREFTDLGYPAREAGEYVRVREELPVDDPDAFAARVVGDSMEPEYREGDVVVFSPALTVKSGMDCFVRLEPDQETTFKRVEWFGGSGGQDEDQREVVEIRLVALNPKYPARVVEREQVAGLYAAVSVIRSVWRK